MGVGEWGTEEQESRPVQKRKNDHFKEFLDCL